MPTCPVFAGLVTCIPTAIAEKQPNEIFSFLSCSINTNAECDDTFLPSLYNMQENLGKCGIMELKS